MNKKILVVSILSVFMLVAITFATAVSSNTASTKKKESPLFKIRTKLAIGERLQTLRENIKAKFIGERMFFLPFILKLKQGDSLRDLLIPTVPYQPTCDIPWCTFAKTNCG